jgi:hypothetical protein
VLFVLGMATALAVVDSVFRVPERLDDHEAQIEELRVLVEVTRGEGSETTRSIEYLICLSEALHDAGSGQTVQECANARAVR